MTRKELPDRSLGAGGDGVDQMLEAYVAWREKCLEVWDAHRRWVQAQTEHAAHGFADYTAALDAEERAAGVYADLVGRIVEVIATQREPVDAARAGDENRATDSESVSW